MKIQWVGRAPINDGIGVHVGDVMDGNIGSSARLDFTVIGPAANMASRVEALTKQLGKKMPLSVRPPISSKTISRSTASGNFPVRGFNASVELFAYGG